mgnify:FL=1
MREKAFRCRRLLCRGRSAQPGKPAPLGIRFARSAALNTPFTRRVGIGGSIRALVNPTGAGGVAADDGMTGMPALPGGKGAKALFRTAGKTTKLSQNWEYDAFPSKRANSSEGMHTKSASAPRESENRRYPLCSRC